MRSLLFALVVVLVLAGTKDLARVCACLCGAMKHAAAGLEILMHELKQEMKALKKQVSDIYLLIKLRLKVKNTDLFVTLHK